MDDEDFKNQLLLEAKEKVLKEVKEKENPYLTRDPNDGTLYEYDPEKRAWFPKIDESFLAYYQQYNYQYVEPEKTKEDKDIKPKKKNDDEKVRPSASTDTKPDDSVQQSRDQIQQTANSQKSSEWFDLDEESSTKVYISNLPADISEEEFVELMQKCGLILKDPESNKFKIKLYRNSDGTLKGDGLCTYIKPESVVLALQILDGYQYKDNELKVERAKFELKGQFDPSKKPRKRKLEDKKRQKEKLQRLFSWQTDKLPEKRSKREKVVILKNFFDPSVFENDPLLIAEYKKDVEEECNEKCGPVKKVEVYDRNPEGVVAVFFKEFEHADKCVSLMNGRFFDGRQLGAENWDGRTRYKVKETAEEEKRRIEEWNKYLDEDA